jgi:hypothetical protein
MFPSLPRRTLFVLSSPTLMIFSYNQDVHFYVHLHTSVAQPSTKCISTTQCWVKALMKTCAGWSSCEQHFVYADVQLKSSSYFPHLYANGNERRHALLLTCSRATDLLNEQFTCRRWAPASQVSIECSPKMRLAQLLAVLACWHCVRAHAMKREADSGQLGETLEQKGFAHADQRQHRTSSPR